MTRQLLIWILFAPFGIFLIMGLLGEVLGLPDSVVGIVALILIVAYFGGLVRIILAVKRGIPQEIRTWLEDKGFTLDGRKATGSWKGKEVMLTYLTGAGGVPDEMKMACGEIRSIIKPVLVKDLEGWLDGAVRQA